MLQIILVMAIVSHVGAWVYAAEPKTIFIGKSGEKLNLEAAFNISAKGETVYRCQAVKATVNKTGTSVTFKVVK